MKIAHITTVHKRQDTRIFFKQCRSAAAAGHEVFLICADGLGDHEMDGVRIIDVGKSKGRFDRALNATRKIQQKLLDLGPDFVHFHDPELIPVALSMAQKGVKVIYDVHENVLTDILTKHWIPQPLRRITAAAAGVAEEFGARRFHRIAAATPTIAERFPSTKTAVIANYPLTGELSATSIRPKGGERPAFVYAGGITYNRGFSEMIEATVLLRAKGQPTDLVLAGSLADPAAMTGIIASNDGVSFHGFLGRRDLGALLSTAAAGLVVLHPEPSYVNALPIKMFEYMSAGIPVIASNFALWRQIVEGGGCGICVDPLDAGQLADAMLWIQNNPQGAAEMGRRGQALVADQYNWESQVPSFLELYAG